MWGENQHPLRNLLGTKHQKASGECNGSARAWSSGKAGGLGTAVLWDVLSLPAPATCGSPFPSPLIRLQLPALLTFALLSPGIFQTTWVEAFLHSPVWPGAGVSSWSQPCLCLHRCLAVPCQNPGSQNAPNLQSNHFCPAPPGLW